MVLIVFSHMRCLYTPRGRAIDDRCQTDTSTPTASGCISARDGAFTRTLIAPLPPLSLLVAPEGRPLLTWHASQNGIAFSPGGFLLGTQLELDDAVITRVILGPSGLVSRDAYRTPVRSTIAMSSRAGAVEFAEQDTRACPGCAGERDRSSMWRGSRRRASAM